MKAQHCKECGTKMNLVQFKGGGSFYCPSLRCTTVRHFNYIKEQFEAGKHSGVCNIDCILCYPQAGYDGRADVRMIAGLRVN